MTCSAFGDYGIDAPRTQCLAVGFGIIGAVREEPFGALAWPAYASADRRECVDQRQQLRDIVTRSSGQEDGENHAARVSQEVVLASGLPSIRGVRLGFFPPRPRHGRKTSLRRRATNRCARRHSIGPEAPGECDPKRPPSAVAQAAPTGHPRTPHLGRKVFPGDAGMQNEKETGQRRAVFDGLAARKTFAAFLSGRQERLNFRPERIIQKGASP